MWDLPVILVDARDKDGFQMCGNRIQDGSSGVFYGLEGFPVCRTH